MQRGHHSNHRPEIATVSVDSHRALDRVTLGVFEKLLSVIDRSFTRFDPLKRAMDASLGGSLLPLSCRDPRSSRATWAATPPFGNSKKWTRGLGEDRESLSFWM